MPRKYKAAINEVCNSENHKRKGESRADML
jgi:hypothetical protein